MPDTMKAISLWQPWASLWLSPAKRHETRHWQTRYRGKLLVHAAKKLVDGPDGDLAGILIEQFGQNWRDALRYGAILGMVDLVDVVPTERIVNAWRWTDEERTDNACGNFDDGRYGWKRGTYWVFPEPIPYRGRQTLFDVPMSVVADQIGKAREVVGG